VVNKSCSEAPFLHKQTSRSSAGRTNGSEVCSYSCLWNTTGFLLRIIQLVNLKRTVNRSKFAITGKTKQKDDTYVSYSVMKHQLISMNFKLHSCLYF